MLTKYNTWVLLGVMEEKSSCVVEVRGVSLTSLARASDVSLLTPHSTSTTISRLPASTVGELLTCWTRICTLII